MKYKITSLQNTKIKFADSLSKSQVRKQEKLFLIEGIREIRLALHSGYEFNTLFICPEIVSRITADNISGAGEKLAGINEIVAVAEKREQVYEVSPHVFRKLVYRADSEGLLAIARQKITSLPEIKLGKIPLLLVAESIEKPGNLGAMLRTADAAGVDAVIVCGASVDIFNPNTIRSSLGAIFALQVTCCSSAEAVSWIKSRNIKIFTTALSSSKPYHLSDYTRPAAIVAGAEATGVSHIWEENSDENIIIPMFGKVDSINVSVATSIVLYEVLRQRQFS